MATIGGYTMVKLEERATARGRSVDDQMLLDARSSAAKRRMRPNRRKGKDRR
jgi:hypothetical protein